MFLSDGGAVHCKGRGWMGRNKEMSGIEMHDVKSIESIKCNTIPNLHCYNEWIALCVPVHVCLCVYQSV